MCTEGKFLLQVTEEQARRGAMLDLVLIHGHDDEDCGAQGQLTTE